MSKDRSARLRELKEHLLRSDFPLSSINYAFSKVFSPKQEQPASEAIVFTSTYNPSHAFDQRVIRNCLNDLRTPTMIQAFGNHRVILGTRQPKSLRSLLTRSRFSRTTPIPRAPREVGLKHCSGVCKYHRLGYVIECTSFNFGLQQVHEWIYNHPFDCNCRNVIYVVQCSNCWMFYIGETEDLKQRTRLHISNTHKPENSNCKKLCRHLKRCSKLKHPYFKIFPIYYVENRSHRKFMEKRFIQRYKPPLNSDK